MQRPGRFDLRAGLRGGVPRLLPLPADRRAGVGVRFGVCREQTFERRAECVARIGLRQAGGGGRERACHGDGLAAREARRAHLGHGAGRLGGGGLLPLPRQEIYGDDQQAGRVFERFERTAGRQLQDSRGLRRRARSDRARRRQASGAERHRRHAELRVFSDVRPGRNADRAASERPGLAHHGEHLGGELGQQQPGLGVRREFAGIGDGAVSRGRAGRRSHRQDLYGLAGAELLELRAIAGGADAASAIHVPDHACCGERRQTERGAGGVRRALPAAGREAGGSEARGSDAGAYADARARGHARHAARRRLSKERVAEARVGDVRGQPGERLGVRSRGESFGAGYRWRATARSPGR